MIKRDLIFELYRDPNCLGLTVSRSFSYNNSFLFFFLPPSPVLFCFWYKRFVFLFLLTWTYCFMSSFMSLFFFYLFPSFLFLPFLCPFSYSFFFFFPIAPLSSFVSVSHSPSTLESRKSESVEIFPYKPMYFLAS
uniref:Uncharacterized protein n=1 Tax=Cacopsylla melanoneura TaxID=428564 RepID=A0A8D8ZIF3_9HEMI